MLNSIPNHFSYLFENKNVQTVNKKKTISKSKEEVPKTVSKKKKINEITEEKDLKKEESCGSESGYYNSQKQNSCQLKSSGFNSVGYQENTYSYSPQEHDEKNFYFIESKMELDAALINYQSNSSNQDKSQIQKKSSFIQQEEIEDFDSFDENNYKMKLNSTESKNNSEGKLYPQLVSNPLSFLEKQINQERNEEALSDKSNNNNIKNPINHGQFQIKTSSQPQQAAEVIYWRRANQLQTKFQTKFRSQSNSNHILLQGDLCLEINQDDYNCYLQQVPLSAFKRISNIKKYHEGKIEVQLITDVQANQEFLFTKHEEGQIQQNNSLSSSSIDSQIKGYQAKIEQQKLTFSQIKQQSSTIFENLKDHVNIKKQQFLNKIDFERKYIFAIEFHFDELEGISSIKNVYYSKQFLSIMGLGGKDSAFLEAYLLQNGVIDLHEYIGLYNKKKDKQGDLISQYFEPLTESQYNLNTLDNLQVNVSINHRIVNLSEEFVQMFADIGLQNISKEYFILYELDIPYDQIKQIENERKQIEKNAVPYFLAKNAIPNLLLTKYYSIPNNLSSSA